MLSRASAFVAKGQENRLTINNEAADVDAKEREGAVLARARVVLHGGVPPLLSAAPSYGSGDPTVGPQGNVDLYVDKAPSTLTSSPGGSSAGSHVASPRPLASEHGDVPVWPAVEGQTVGQGAESGSGLAAGESKWVYGGGVTNAALSVIRDSAGRPVNPHPPFDAAGLVFPLHSATTHSLPNMGLPLSTTFSTGVATLALRDALVPAPDEGGPSPYTAQPAPGNRTASGDVGHGAARTEAGGVKCLPPPIALAIEWLRAFGVGASGGCLAAVPEVLEACTRESAAGAAQFLATPLGLCIGRLQFAEEPMELQQLIDDAVFDLGGHGVGGPPPRPVDVVMGILCVGCRAGTHASSSPCRLTCVTVLVCIACVVQSHVSKSATRPGDSAVLDAHGAGREPCRAAWRHRPGRAGGCHPATARRQLPLLALPRALLGPYRCRGADSGAAA